NVRVVFGDPDRDRKADVILENHYYPFGMTFGGLEYSAGLENRYLYQGKETTGDFGLWWSDFSARRFDSQLGRWHIPDPAGQFASPYLGMGNSPVAAVDPSGLWAVDGRFAEMQMLRQAEQKVRDFQKQLMESFSYEEMERELEMMLLWEDILSGKYKKDAGIGQPELEGSPDDPPGNNLQNGNNGNKNPDINSPGLITQAGLTFTLAAGIIGGSIEFGIAYDGINYSLYLTLEHSTGFDISAGGIVNVLISSEGHLTFDQVEGWGESYNSAIWIIDGTYGGDSFYPGLKYEDYRDIHNTYQIYGLGLSWGLPIGFTKNKGYSWYFLKF
ncbi:MAG: hypothetical protein K0B08_01840, partial [Bacteroidales bacterium]|nr:hypothetical protein [Bacteroidales bacterium]